MDYDFGIPEPTTLDINLLCCDDTVSPRIRLDDERWLYYQTQ
jgi:hypothetical protein